MKRNVSANLRNSVSLSWALSTSSKFYRPTAQVPNVNSMFVSCKRKLTTSNAFKRSFGSLKNSRAARVTTSRIFPSCTRIFNRHFSRNGKIIPNSTTSATLKPSKISFWTRLSRTASSFVSRPSLTRLPVPCRIQSPFFMLTARRASKLGKITRIR